MRVLIIGGSKFIGLGVVRRLCELGHDVAVLNRGKSKAQMPEGVTHLIGDRDDLPAAREDVSAFAPDVILHNVVSHQEHAAGLLELARGICDRLVMTSSMDVYAAFGRLHGTEEGEPDHSLQTENSALRSSAFPYRAQADDESDMRWHYDKIPAEELLMQDEGFACTVLRLPMVFGPGDYQHRLFGFVQPMVDGRPGIVLEENHASWKSTYGYIDNVADAIATACVDDRARGRVYNIGDAVLSTAELVGLIAEDLEWQGRIVRRPAAGLPKALLQEWGTQHWLNFSSERIRIELDWQPTVELHESIHCTVAWEHANPPDPAPEKTLDYEAEDTVLASIEF